MGLYKYIIYTSFIIYILPAEGYEIRDERNKLYIGANLGFFDEVIEGNGSVLGFNALVGYDLASFLAVETQLGYTGDEAEVSNGTDSASLKTHIVYVSAYLRGNWRFDEFTPYVFGGYTFMYADFKASTTLSFPGLPSSVNDSENFDGVSYGIGIDLYGNSTTALSFKWIRVIDFAEEDGDGELDNWVLGLTHYLN
ncbi:MAG: outer membrane beta-barrel protein [Gammaproteobacteria bacterium]